MRAIGVCMHDLRLDACTPALPYVVCDVCDARDVAELHLLGDAAVMIECCRNADRCDWRLIEQMLLTIVCICSWQLTLLQ